MARSHTSSRFRSHGRSGITRLRTSKWRSLEERPGTNSMLAMSPSRSRPISACRSAGRGSRRLRVGVPSRGRRGQAVLLGRPPSNVHRLARCAMPIEHWAFRVTFTACRSPTKSSICPACARIRCRRDIRRHAPRILHDRLREADPSRRGLMHCLRFLALPISAVSCARSSRRVDETPV